MSWFWCFVFWVSLVYCATKNKYRINLERFEVVFNDSIGDANGQLKFFNRTHKTINMNLTLFRPLNDTEIVKFVAYKWSGNSYKLTSIQFTKPLSELLTNEDFDVPALTKKHIKPPMVLPLKTNVTYKLDNYIIDSSKYPPNIPFGRWKLSMDILTQSNVSLVMFIVMGSVDEIVTW